MQFLIITLKRAGFGLVLLVAVLALNFVLIHIAPGDVADTIAQDAGGLDAEIMEQIRKDYGLDLPLWEQMAKYFWGVARLDLGYSFYYNEPVTKLIIEATSHSFVSDQCPGYIHFLGHIAWCHGSSKPKRGDKPFCYRVVFGRLCGAGILDRYHDDNLVFRNHPDFSHRKHDRCVSRKGRDRLRH